MAGTCRVGWASRSRSWWWNNLGCHCSCRISQGNCIHFFTGFDLCIKTLISDPCYFLRIFLILRDIDLMICEWLVIWQRANDLVRNKIHPISIISSFRVTFSSSIMVIFFSFMRYSNGVIWTCFWVLLFVQLAMREACKYVEEKLAVKVSVLLRSDWKVNDG